MGISIFTIFLRLFGLSFAFLISPVESFQNEESILLQSILKDYNPLARPVKAHNDVINLTLGLSLNQLLQVDEKHQTITTNIWLRMKWTDQFLKWNSSNHSNISEIWIPRKRIWIPDIRLYNIASEDTTGGDQDNTLSVVDSEGRVMDIAAMVTKSTCRMDVTWFPFDEQKCILKYGSWSFTGKYLILNLESESAVTKNFVDNGEWKLVNVPAVVHTEYFPCCPEPYMDIVYTIHLKRRTLYYFYNLLVPCALIGFLALLGFTLPPDSGEKLPLGVTVLFSLIVFLNMIAESMPANTDSVPLLGTYFNCVMFMIALSVVSTVVINLNQRATHVNEIQGHPKKLLLQWLPWILRMSPPPPLSFSYDTDVHENVKSSAVKNLLRSRVDPSDVAGINDGREMSSNGYLESRNEGSIVAGAMQKSTRNSFDVDSIKQQWKFAAIVIDRLCLILSLIFTFVSVLILFLSAF